jgi:hypothetical protein
MKVLCSSQRIASTKLHEGIGQRTVGSSAATHLQNLIMLADNVTCHYGT